MKQQVIDLTLKTLSESATCSGSAVRNAADKRRRKFQHILDAMPAQIDAIKALREREINGSVAKKPACLLLDNIQFTGSGPMYRTLNL